MRDWLNPDTPDDEKKPSPHQPLPRQPVSDLPFETAVKVREVLGMVRDFLNEHYPSMLEGLEGVEEVETLETAFDLGRMQIDTGTVDGKAALRVSFWDDEVGSYKVFPPTPKSLGFVVDWKPKPNMN